MVKKTSALVMKVNEIEGTMLVVTDQGDFWTVPLLKPLPLIGSQVEVEAPQEPVQRKISSPAQHWLAPVAACFLLIFILGANWLFFTDREPTASSPAQLAQVNPETNKPVTPSMADQPSFLVAIDINPSLELSLDENLNYLAGQGINRDGVVLLEKAQLKPGTPLVIAAQQLVVAARENGFFSKEEENLVLATLIKADLNTPEDLVAISKASQQVETTLILALEGENIAAQVALRTGTTQEVAAAKEQQTSVNRLHLIDQLAQQGFTIDSEEAKMSQIVKVIKDAGLPPGQVIKELRSTRTKPAQSLEENLAHIKEQENEKRQKDTKQPPGQEKKNPNPAPEVPKIEGPKPIQRPEPMKRPNLERPSPIGKPEGIRDNEKIPPGQQKKQP